MVAQAGREHLGGELQEGVVEASLPSRRGSRRWRPACRSAPGPPPARRPAPRRGPAWSREDARRRSTGRTSTCALRRAGAGSPRRRTTSNGGGREGRVPLGLVPGRDAEEVERHHLAVEQGDDAVDRAHPGPLAAPPPHGLGPGDAGQHARHDLGQHVAGGPPVDLLGRAPGTPPCRSAPGRAGPAPGRCAWRSRAGPGVGEPSAPKAARTGGPITCSSRSGSRSGRPVSTSTSRRGVKPVSTSRGPTPRAISSSKTRVASSLTPGSSMRAGISSLRTSSRYSPAALTSASATSVDHGSARASPWSSGKPSFSRLST